MQKMIKKLALQHTFVNCTFTLHQKEQELWRKSKEPIEGIKWASGDESVTHDIWMWSEPVVIEESGRKVGIVIQFKNYLLLT